MSSGFHLKMKLTGKTLTAGNVKRDNPGGKTNNVCLWRLENSPV